MRPVERQTERVHRIEISAKEAFPFLRRFRLDDFPAGPFLVVCPILGAASCYWTGTFALNALGRDEPLALFLWVSFGAAFGITFGIKFLIWLADNSYE